MRYIALQVPIVGSPSDAKCTSFVTKKISRGRLFLLPSKKKGFSTAHRKKSSSFFYCAVVPRATLHPGLGDKVTRKRVKDPSHPLSWWMTRPPLHHCPRHSCPVHSFLHGYGSLHQRIREEEGKATLDSLINTSNSLASARSKLGVCRRGNGSY